MEKNVNTENVRAQMRKGVLEYCILLLLAKEDAYASSIISKLKESNMIVVEGTLYPLLIRQKNQGLLQYRWEESPQGPPRKYYAITDKGREQLEEMNNAWKEIVTTIENIKN
ncbi:MAG: PadR family transcriptional regulator [Bacteroidales bacterium]|jgi:PadR family transcriptional regulator PadR|nr:PadR family transcriptional regulator [Bacteroidales bacterium]MBQ4021483.1 PadR family transcriptional regulator [Bacteroidales bacterium]MBR3526849.1 PadR family transcriptional regulator [Bacteroidales bacterium]MCR5828233.1 PadR family transcriptional regulator [Bacteroidales bacterium]